MNKAEIAEAIIVVGPFLWKCVNCNLLFSREHSIDDHLIARHRSGLLPDVQTKSKCNLPICSCQNLSGDMMDKKTSRVKRSKRKRIEMDLEEEDFSTRSSDNELSSNSLNKRVDLDCNLNSIEQPVEHCDSSLSNSKTEESTAVAEECESHEQENTSESSSRREEKVPNQTKSVDEGEDETTDMCSEKEVSPLKSWNDSPHKSQETDVTALNKTESQKPSIKEQPDPLCTVTRKSRRTNKGRHSLYDEYEMKIS